MHKNNICSIRHYDDLNLVYIGECHYNGNYNPKNICIIDIFKYFANKQKDASKTIIYVESKKNSTNFVQIYNYATENGIVCKLFDNRGIILDKIIEYYPGIKTKIRNVIYHEPADRVLGSLCIETLVKMNNMLYSGANLEINELCDILKERLCVYTEYKYKEFKYITPDLLEDVKILFSKHLMDDNFITHVKNKDDSFYFVVAGLYHSEYFARVISVNFMYYKYEEIKQLIETDTG